MIVIISFHVISCAFQVRVATVLSVLSWAGLFTFARYGIQLLTMSVSFRRLDDNSLRHVCGCYDNYNYKLTTETVECLECFVTYNESPHLGGVSNAIESRITVTPCTDN